MIDLDQTIHWYLMENAQEPIDAMSLVKRTAKDMRPHIRRVLRNAMNKGEIILTDKLNLVVHDADSN